MRNFNIFSQTFGLKLVKAETAGVTIIDTSANIFPYRITSQSMLQSLQIMATLLNLTREVDETKETSVIS